MVDVLLIHPPCDDRQRIRDPQTTLPLGLGYLAATIIEEGFSVKVFDLNNQPANTTHLLREILRDPPRVVGLGVTTPALRSSYEIVKAIQVGVGADIVLGGPHITANPSILGYFGVRYGFSGDVWWGFAGLCKHLIWGGKKLSKIPSLILNDGDEVRINKKEEVRLDKLRRPARHVFSVSEYRNMAVICSWGCPYECGFCSLSNTEYMNRAPEDVVDEIIEITGTYPFARVGFVDNVFTLRRGLVEEICYLLGERGARVPWSCTTRVDLVDEKLLKVMRSAGCEHISFGVESGVEEIRARSGKDISNRRYEEVFRMCHQLGIKIRAHAIFGHPNETIGDMTETISFMKKINPDYAVFSTMTLYPKTPLTKDLLSTGELKPDVWARYMKGECDLPEYTPKNMTSRDIHYLILDAVKSFYFRPQYLLCRTLNMRSYCDVREVFSLFYSMLGEGVDFT